MKDELSVLIRNEEQYQVLKKYPITRIYSNNLDLVHQHSEIYYQVPRIHGELKDLPEHLLINDVGLLKEYPTKHMISDYYMNISNHASCDLLQEYHIEKINLSLEMTLPEIELFKDIKNYPIEVFVYGRVEDMLLKSHPIFTKNGYSIKQEDKEFPIMVDDDLHAHIYHFEPLNRIDNIPSYKALEIHSFRIDFLEETSSEMKSALDLVCQYLTD